VIALLRSMLAVDPAKRPQTARELLSAVHRCYIKFSTEARARKKRFMLAATGATAVIGAIAIGTWLYQRVQSSAEIERSIAVLPFENLSATGEDAYFTVGMQDEITDDLAKVAGMKVIGSQSTRSYVPGKERNLHAIGRDLGVRHLLEGTVSRDHDQMRVALHLVDLRDSSHPWTESYERPMRDVFALQSQITREIATRLKTQLSPGETAALNVPPTNDLKAYDLYLRAVTLPRLVKDSAEQVQNTEQCIALLEKAVAIDPNFVAAYCEIAESHDVLYRTRQVLPPESRSVDHRALAETALAVARRIQPDAGRVHLALANHFFSTNNDLEQARIEVELARRTMPNSADLELTAGAIARNQGRWDEAIHDFERAVALEPRQNVNRFTLANTQRLVRHYDDFDRLIAEVIKMLPPQESATYRVFRCMVTMEKTGEVAPLRAALNNLTSEDDVDGRIRDLHSVILGLADHNAASVSRSLAPAAGSTFVFNGVAYPKSWYEGLAARMRGDKKGAQAAFATARVEVEKTVLADPSDARALSLLAMIDAGLGKKEQSVREAEHACELAPFESLAMDAPIVRCNLAVVYAWNGQTDLAISELNTLVNTPAGSNLPAQPTYGDFKLNPLWDPLRGDPRFTEIMNRLAPVGTSPK
jgi:TolB-like protein/tetratricopeptide (TPR) repeat protein